MNLSEVVTMIFQAVLVPLILWGLAELKQYLLVKAQTTEAENAIILADNIITAVVAETSQTFVDGLKASGEWNADKVKEAFDTSYNKAKELMTDGTIQLLEQVTGDANAYITAKIEEAVRGG